MTQQELVADLSSINTKLGKIRRNVSILYQTNVSLGDYDLPVNATFKATVKTETETLCDEVDTLLAGVKAGLP